MRLIHIMLLLPLVVPIITAVGIFLVYARAAWSRPCPASCSPM
jgi:hypothetical protein